MNTKDYNEHFNKLHQDHNRIQKSIDDMENSDFDNCEVKFDLDLKIRSINNNEPSTVTLHFYQVDADGNRIQNLIYRINNFLYPIQQDLGLYTAKCYQERVGQVDGIALITTTVENNEKQSSEIIQEKFLHIMDTDLYEQLELVQDDLLMTIYNNMIRRKIHIQVCDKRKLINQCQ